MSGSGLSAERISELRRLCEAATPGPWLSEIDGYGVKEVIGPRLINIDDGSGLRKYPCYADLTFIAASRTALPELLDALEAAQKPTPLVTAALALAEKYDQYLMAGGFQGASGELEGERVEALIAYRTAREEADRG